MYSYIEKAKTIHDLAKFLAELNNHKSSHIGYCGKNSDEIYHTLLNDFQEKNGELRFIVTRNDSNEIIGAIGLDLDEHTAEVWGPFNKNASKNIEDQLWEHLIKEYPNVNTFYFFINRENERQMALVEALKAKMTGEHLILEIQKENAINIPNKRNILFTEDNFKAFELLHNQAFPNTYYDAKTIASRLNENHILKLLITEDNQFQGYAYYEIDKEHSEASLEYIAVSPSYQNQGLGTLLLKEIIDEIFTYPNINDIKLCVNNTNDSANHIYLKAGFEQKDVLVSFVLKL